jgi:transposase
MTHDYTRHGTITLFTALDAMKGKLIARTEARHTHVEWLRFLKQIDRETPEELDVHLIQDNYATHKHPKVKAWLARHPRFKSHFTPTSSSWMNLVERFFADLTADVIRSGSFASIGELVRDIEAYLSDRNAAPKPYTWKAEGAAILEKINRARAAFSPDGKRIVTASRDKTVRLLRIFPGGTEEIVAVAKAASPRCLTAEQRHQFFLPAEPPTWCIEQEKWPYDTLVWKQWLSSNTLTGRRPPLPSAP